MNKSEKKELKELALSMAFRSDMDKAARARSSRSEREIPLDEFVSFLNAYNGFVNHQPRQFRKIEGGKWRA
ncbi:MAG: hypothetical protein FD189_452 [Elusimicrobia bacterium]|nr:MAG: hypothetical protein FD154_513 [Elusimicrobiota bacterium]KAF0157677.1 MAG: hypothetical protein FD189_452 [Elusimicrobiota bacterium]